MKMNNMVLQDVNYDTYIEEFLTSSGRRKYYSIRDNCGPCALDFIDFMKTRHNIGLTRVQGEFYTDVPVHSKHKKKEKKKNININKN